MDCNRDARIDFQAHAVDKGGFRNYLVELKIGWQMPFFLSCTYSESSMVSSSVVCFCVFLILVRFYCSCNLYPSFSCCTHTKTGHAWPPIVPQEKLHREVAQRHQEVAAFVDGILLQTKSSTLDGPGHQSPVVKPSIHSGCSMNRILILYHFGTLNLPPFVQILLPFPFVNSSSF